MNENGRVKSLKLCLVFTLSGLLTLMCLARTSVSIPPEVSQYLDIAMAVLMVLLLLCVLELCLGVEVCGGVLCCRYTRALDAERRSGDSEPPTPEFSESPPSYDTIMAQGRAEAHTEAAAGEERAHESLSLKRDFSFHFKPPGPDDHRLPPMRPFSPRGVSEMSSVSPGELWLAVDGLPTYEEAVARQPEEEEEVAAVQEGETDTLNQEMKVMQQEEEEEEEEDAARWVPEDAVQQEEQASAGGMREEGSR